MDSSQVISQTYKLGCRLEAVAAVVSSRRILRSCRYTQLDGPRERYSPQKPHNVDPTILGSTTKQTEFARFLLGHRTGQPRLGWSAKYWAINSCSWGGPGYPCRRRPSGMTLAHTVIWW